MTPKNWKLNSYTAETATNIVAEAAIVTTIIISNISANAIDVSLILGVNVILPTVVIPPGVSQAVDVRSLCVMSSEALQGKASAVGIHFTVSGAV